MIRQRHCLVQSTEERVKLTQAQALPATLTQFRSPKLLDIDQTASNDTLQAVIKVILFDIELAVDAYFYVDHEMLSA